MQKPADPKRVLEICDEALARDGEQRAAYLDQACTDDPALRLSVDSVLVAVNQADGFLDDDSAAAFDSTDFSGRRISSYKILDRLGKGGMGSVYLAERNEEGFQQQVAVKFVHGHLLARELVERFNAERQILAALNHPYIAALIDGGATDEGIPYLVMEFVNGVPIDQYCDTNRLDLRSRIELIQKVATAVQFAHQNLVVHRDLKPSNVLITADGIPKLLDFGIAKIIQTDEQENLSNTTVFGRQAMTPDYASPEQILENKVTTASDVYTLGVLAYLLLVGERPYRIQTSSHRQMVQAVEGLTVPRPSTRLDTLASAALRADIAKQRATTVNQLKRSLQGDLDNVLLMALRMEPDRRYHSVAQFADDLSNYLSDLPVIARQDSVPYRTRKFLQRNWLATGAAALIFLSLGIGVLAYSSQASEAQRQRDLARDEAIRAENTVDFLKDVLFAGDPFSTSENEQTIDDVLLYAENHVDDEYADAPSSRATILTALGDIYAARGDYERSEKLAASAVAIYENELVAEGNAAANAYRAHGLALFYIDNYEQADQLLARAIELYVSQDSPNWSGLVNAYQRMGSVQGYLTDESTALKFYDLALSTYRERGLDDSAQLISLLSNLGNQHLQTAEYEEANEFFREAVELAGSSGASDAQTGLLLGNHAGALKNLGRAEEATMVYERAIELISASLGPNHPELVITLTSLANLHQQVGKLDDAESVIRRAVEAAANALAPDRFITSYAQNVAGAIFCRNGKAGEGMAHASASLKTRRDLLPAGHWAISSGEGIVGACHVAAGEYETAEKILLPALAALRESRGENHEVTITTRKRVHGLYIAWRNPDEAEKFDVSVD